MSRIIIPLLLCGSSVLAQNVHASDQYFFAEKYFDQLESSGTLLDDDEAASIANGYYSMSFNKGAIRYGVSTDASDTNYYKYTSSTGWQSVGQWPTLLASLKGTTIAAIKLPRDALGKQIRASSNIVDPVSGINNDIILGHSPWSEQNNRIILAAYNAGRSIVLIEPSANDLRKLQKLLGNPTGASDIKAAKKYAVYGINNSNVETNLSILVDQKPEADKSNSNNRSTFTSRQLEVSSLLDWIRREATVVGNSITSPRVLVSNKLLNSKEYKLPNRPSYEKRYRHTYLNNSYTTRTRVYSFYDSTFKDNYFYVEAGGQWNNGGSADGYNSDAGKIRNMVETYNLITILDRPSGVFIEDKVTPETSQGSTSTTSGMDVSLSGDISNQGVGISGGVTFSSSFSFTTEDVSILNGSDSKNRPSSTQFTYDIRLIDNNSAGNVSTIPKVAYSTFQPTMVWLWKADESARSSQPSGLSAKQLFQARLYDWSRVNRRIQDRKLTFLESTILIPWPQIPK